MDTNKYAETVYDALPSLEESHPEALRKKCPECAEVVDEALDPATHTVMDGYVIVGCEGYFVVDPELVGLPRGNWEGVLS